MRAALTPDAASLLVGESDFLRTLREQIARVADTDVNVLVTGETGTGKELVARCLHQLSSRRAGPFVAINCAAIPAALLESEFFGSEKGAYTSATVARAGRLENASGGTLFLDEIGDMPIDLQVKLLRVLEQRSFERIGGARTLPLECRIVAATHVNLRAAIENGSFREDLFYRLDVVPLHVAPLRERRADIAPIYYRARTRAEMLHGMTFELDAAAWCMLQQHDWPGNVRELMNLVERLTILFAGRTVGVEDLQQHLLQARVIARAAPSESQRAPTGRTQTDAGITPLDLSLPAALAELEARLIEQAMAAAGGVVSRAAELLHIPRTTLIAKLQRSRPADNQQ